MESNTVALSALGVLATCVGLMAWVVKKVLGDVAPALNKHAETAVHLKEAVVKNSEAVGELKDFMVNLNGSLRRVVADKQTQAKE